MRCEYCGEKLDYIPEILKLCKNCLIKNFDNIKEKLSFIHKNSRKRFDLTFPDKRKGIKCGLCARECYIENGERGFCGLRVNKDGKLINFGTQEKGFFQFYYDPLPTNCVADWVCSGHKAHGKHNLAVFYETCSLDCLFCQNYHFRYRKPWKDKPSSYIELVRAFNPSVHCICFFGGDPTTQALHSLKVSEEALKRGIVVCYESNGMWNRKILERVLEVVRESGGILKFDIKAYSPEIYFALTGYDGKRVFENFEFAVNYLGELSAKHLCVSTLMVPGYIDKFEISKIARFIAELKPEIPYALLAFAPHFEMSDIRTTYRKEAEEFYRIAKEKGLKNVRIGNVFLLK